MILYFFSIIYFHIEQDLTALFTETHFPHEQAHGDGNFLNRKPVVRLNHVPGSWGAVFCLDRLGFWWRGLGMGAVEKRPMEVLLLPIKLKTDQINFIPISFILKFCILFSLSP